MQPCCSSRIKTLERLVYVRHRSLPGHSRHHFFAQVGSTSNERISICDRTHPPLYDFLHGRKLFVQHVLDSYGEISQVTTGTLASLCIHVGAYSTRQGCTCQMSVV